MFWQVAIEVWRIDGKPSPDQNQVSKRVSNVPRVILFLILRARNERAVIKSKIQLPLSAERRRDQGQNGINGGLARREDPVYAGFELELAGAERYPGDDAEKGAT